LGRCQTPPRDDVRVVADANVQQHPGRAVAILLPPADGVRRRVEPRGVRPPRARCDGQRYFEETVQDSVPGLWEDRLHDITGVYVFRCPECERVTAHWDIA